MTIISISISGFRSFYQPTKIEFSSNNTIISGDNGSGKSSIISAIRYALGYSFGSLSPDARKSILSESTSANFSSSTAEISLTLSSDLLTSIPSASKEILISENFGITPSSSEIVLRRVISKETDSVFCNGSRLGPTSLFFLLSSLCIPSSNLLSNILQQGKAGSFVSLSPSERFEALSGFIGVSAFERQMKSIKAFVESTTKKELPKMREVKEQFEKEIEKLTGDKKGLDVLKKLEKEKDFLTFKKLVEKKKRLKEKQIEKEGRYKSVVQRINNYSKVKERKKRELELLKKNKNKLRVKVSSNDSFNTMNSTDKNNNIEADFYNESINMRNRNSELKNKEIKESIETAKNLINESSNSKANKIASLLKTHSGKNIDEDLLYFYNRLSSSVSSYSRIVEDLEKKSNSFSSFKNKSSNKEKIQKELSELKLKRRSLWQEKNELTERKEDLSLEKRTNFKELHSSLTSSNLRLLEFSQNLHSKNIKGFKGIFFEHVEIAEKYRNALFRSFQNSFFTFLVSDVRSLETCIRELNSLNSSLSKKNLPKLSISFICLDNIHMNNLKEDRSVDSYEGAISASENEIMKIKVNNDLLEDFETENLQNVLNVLFKGVSVLKEIKEKDLNIFLKRRIKGSFIDKKGVFYRKGEISGGHLGNDFLKLYKEKKQLNSDIKENEVQFEKLLKEIEKVSSEISVLEKESDKSFKEESKNKIKEESFFELEVDILTNKLKLETYSKQRDLIKKFSKICKSGGFSALQKELSSFNSSSNIYEKKSENSFNNLEVMIKEIKNKINSSFSLEEPTEFKEITSTSSNNKNNSNKNNINRKNETSLGVQRKQNILKLTELNRELMVLENENKADLAFYNDALKEKNEVTSYIESISKTVERLQSKYPSELSEGTVGKIQIKKSLEELKGKIEKERRGINKKAEAYYDNYCSKLEEVNKNISEVLDIQNKLKETEEVWKDVKGKSMEDLFKKVSKEFKSLLKFFDNELMLELKMEGEKILLGDSQFSGGQMAVIGICFILSVKMVLGIKFVVFDEVDANLDNKYLVKLAELLKKENGEGLLKGQFILSSFKKNILELEGEKKEIEIECLQGISKIKE